MDPLGPCRPAGHSGSLTMCVGGGGDIVWNRECYTTASILTNVDCDFHEDDKD